jgi:hypothetical protein
MEEVKAGFIGHLRIQYNRDGDVLYVSIGEPRAANTLPDDEGVLIRQDPKTHEIVGVTILDYEERFRHLPDLAWLETKSLPSELLDFLHRRPSV